METILSILFAIIFLWLIVHSINDYLSYKKFATNFATAVQNDLDDFSLRIEDIEDKIGERYNNLEGD
ncbi:hypothetical protein COX24_00805 [bacterium (Candidatus Gribaldobacteria) CG23_combo_of_CG06-09_8_20_14_all_37_87_8]|uniref:Uncharacterized protein n=2 Tax=Candidatus Gribaldobacteria TaxID=2798536 RepID=A0A2G9ZFK6_9BACT|nr:MAG: hypothetical protein AUJ25_03370 [Parcubacteria group bacterium CG1_02_37_13]PIP31944.1 MAG: hypothetical protein COX24_00805 [bacterium (Candidatus Gribaldobacteria) CG23_combo_of_CG06-09_8_20_14_all_37_87_8]PIR90193.1 MAG: hypothetical protein COU05_02810 [bacterium (Candidatus Gribaldobacteria) CG10_big_fil_rev_8_21_14_0_10_37_21]